MRKTTPAVIRGAAAMAQEVHYEIFSRQGAKGSWKMLEVRNDREVAVEFAKSLMADEKATGVKVVKETYNTETSDYLTLKIFEDGHNKYKSTPAQEDAPHALPCFKPDDLYSYHARATISRLLADYLSRNKLTLTELSHRADALERLEATGTLLQHAVQKVAVAQAASTTTPVQQIVKSLNDLVNRAIQKVYRDARDKYFPTVTLSGFNQLAAKLCKEPDGAYVLNGAIALYLRDAKGWDEKIQRLLALTEQADGDGRILLLASIDTIIAEILSGSAALRELIGVQENFGDELASLVELFLGTETSRPNHQGVTALIHHFAADDLPEARTAIAQRLMAEFKSVKRLRPASLVDEFQTLRKIADRLVRGVGKYLSHDDLIAAFTLRSKRLVTNETVNEHLADAATPGEKLNRLFSVEENIIGAENKRRLAEFIIPIIITSLAFETYFQNPKMPVLSRLQALASLQARAFRSGLQDNQKQEIAALFDRMASEIEQHAKLLESLVSHGTSAVDRTSKLLKFCAGGYLTEGRLASRARELVIAQLAQPGFLTGYVAQQTPHGEKPNAQAAMTMLIASLGKAGISREDGLKSIAA
jgi:hypothetical protein